MKMQDISTVLSDRPGALATFGEVLGAAGVSLEGGGVFTTAEGGIAHFLVDDAMRARQALESAGIGPVVISDVVTVRLRQAVPGQLGLLARRMADAGVNILVQYSDHDGNLVLIVPTDQVSAATGVAQTWATAGAR